MTTRKSASEHDRRPKLTTHAGLTRPDGSPNPDDWTPEDDAGQPPSRIYVETGGPQGGCWLRAVLVAPDGTPSNAGTRHEATAGYARETVEAGPAGASMKRR